MQKKKKENIKEYENIKLITLEMLPRQIKLVSSESLRSWKEEETKYRQTVLGHDCPRARADHSRRASSIKALLGGSEKYEALALNFDVAARKLWKKLKHRHRFFIT